MKKNMGSIDKVLRIIVALIFAVLIYTGKVQGTTAIILGVLGGVFVLTSLVSICPLYLPFNINTCKKSD